MGIHHINIPSYYITKKNKVKYMKVCFAKINPQRALIFTLFISFKMLFYGEPCAGWLLFLSDSLFLIILRTFSFASIKCVIVPASIQFKIRSW